MRKLLLVLLLCFTQFGYTAEIDANKKRLIDEMLVQAGQSAKNVGQQMSTMFTSQMISAIKQAKPDVDAKVFDIVQDEITKTINMEINKGTFFEMLYPIYDQYFTQEDLKAIIAFNNTPAGKKAIKVMPLITRDSMVAGQKWGASLNPILQERLSKRLKAEGVNLN